MTVSRPKVLIIYTGGTIGSVQEPETQSYRPFDFDHLDRHVPELKQFDYDLSAIAFEEPIDSSNMHPDVWVRLAEMIRDNYDQHDGFVILHGSDTMAYTASALSFMLENLNKPVILTGSQLPIGVIRTDGKENLISAIEIAAARKAGSPVIAEVALYFENQLFRGNRTHKSSAEHFDAFVSPNYPPLAEVGVYIKYNESVLRKCNLLELKIHTDLNPNINVLSIYPGINEAAVRAILNTQGLKGLILHTFGTGNAPTQAWFLSALREAIENGLIVLNITQCMAGKVEQGRYETSLELKRMGVVSGGDMTLESAITKFMHVLGNHQEPEQVKKLLQSPLRGEITE